MVPESFSVFYILIFIQFFKYETIETHASIILSHNNSSVAKSHNLLHLALIFWHFSKIGKLIF